MKVLITGASGFVGNRAVEACLKTDWIQTVIANDWDAQVGKKMQTMGAYFVLGHLKERDIANTITKNIDAVIHCGGRYVYWGKQEDFYRDNVVCTENLLRACRKNGVPRLVMLSSASVYHTGQERFNVSETEALPTKMMTYQADTLLKAEQLLHKAYEKGMATIALRPHFLIGRGDVDFLPKFIRLQKKNKLRILGDGENIVDITSIDNLVHAMLLALQSPKRTWGQPFNITDGKSVLFWELIKDMLAQMNLPFSGKKMGLGMAYNKARLAELSAKMMGNQQQSGWSMHDVFRLSTTNTLGLNKAKNLLGYRPIQTTAETLQQFVDWWKRKAQGLDEMPVIRAIRDSLTPPKEDTMPIIASTPTGSVDLFQPLPEEMLKAKPIEKQAQTSTENELDLSLFEPPSDDLPAQTIAAETKPNSTLKEALRPLKKVDLEANNLGEINLFQRPKGMEQEAEAITPQEQPIKPSKLSLEKDRKMVSKNKQTESKSGAEKPSSKEENATEKGFWLFDSPDDDATTN